MRADTEVSDPAGSVGGTVTAIVADHFFVATASGADLPTAPVATDGLNTRTRSEATTTATDRARMRELALTRLVKMLLITRPCPLRGQ